MRTHFFWVLATLIITACNNKQFKDMERIAHCSSRSDNKRNNPHGMRLDSR